MSEMGNKRRGGGGGRGGGGRSGGPKKAKFMGVSPGRSNSATTASGHYPLISGPHPTHTPHTHCPTFLPSSKAMKPTPAAVSIGRYCNTSSCVTRALLPQPAAVSVGLYCHTSSCVSRALLPHQQLYQ